jgi:glycosyltransferase involved in cell wall biosynthesis
MNVRDSTDTLPAAADSVRGLIDTWLLIDTGSTDNTPTIANDCFDVPGELIHCRWIDFGFNRTFAVQAAKGRASWLLWMDDDTTYSWHPDLHDWLDEHPNVVDAWNVEVDNMGLRYYLPLLIYGDYLWRYTGKVHEYLEPEGRRFGTLTGLTLHGSSGGNRNLEDDLARLHDDYGNDPRATFYYAQTLKDLGRLEEAVHAYQLRARMPGWDEETWYASYMAARLAQDIPGLIDAWRQRPWRHEPLTAAGRIVASQANPDVLFKEAV